MPIRIRKGSVIGREHIRIWRNNQDGVFSATMAIGDRDYHVGIICDGCTAGVNSEVGAKLLSAYLGSEIRMMLLSGVEPKDIPAALYARAIGYLRSIASLTMPDNSLDFIKHHLLCTVIGFVADAERCYIFNAGDGTIIIGDETTKMDQDNKPRYIGYHLVDVKYLLQQNGRLPDGFEVRVADLGHVERIAICSDGIEDEAIPLIWGHRHELGLMRKLRVLSNHQIPFEDDCSVITLEIIEETEAPASACQEGST